MRAGSKSGKTSAPRWPQTPFLSLSHIDSPGHNYAIELKGLSVAIFLHGRRRCRSPPGSRDRSASRIRRTAPRGAHRPLPSAELALYSRAVNGGLTGAAQPLRRVVGPETGGGRMAMVTLGEAARLPGLCNGRQCSRHGTARRLTLPPPCPVRPRALAVFRLIWPARTSSSRRSLGASTTVGITNAWISCPGWRMVSSALRRGTVSASPWLLTS
jgi:hypothetical protein